MKLRSLDIDDFFKITSNFDGKETSVSRKTEEEKNTAKTTTDDDDEIAGDNERIHKDKGKLVTMEENRNTFEYYEAMNLEIENIANTS